jgi:hypothetical protein
MVIPGIGSKSGFWPKKRVLRDPILEEKPGFWAKNLPPFYLSFFFWKKCHLRGLRLDNFHDHRSTAGFDQKQAKKGPILARFLSFLPKSLFFLPPFYLSFFRVFRARNPNFGPKTEFLSPKSSFCLPPSPFLCMVKALLK